MKIAENGQSSADALKRSFEAVKNRAIAIGAVVPSDLSGRVEDALARWIPTHCEATKLQQLLPLEVKDSGPFQQGVYFS